MAFQVFGFSDHNVDLLRFGESLHPPILSNESLTTFHDREFEEKADMAVKRFLERPLTSGSFRGFEVTRN